jgi:HCOMODA/2-hydroxy-3-carboxy-muconic semialdehyde decarboxylase
MPATVPALAPHLLEDLIAGNKILYHFGVVDAFGHLSVRHDADPTKYVMSRHLAPGLVTPDDLVTFDLDSNPIVETSHRFYSERYIHGEIYKKRPDVQSVVHCHAPALIPFGITKAKLLPVYHMSGFLGTGPKVFEIRETGGWTNMLVRTAPLGAALADVLGDDTVVLMRGHGATMVGATIRESVYRAIYATQNAQIELQALQLGGGDVTFLDPREAELYDKYSGEVAHRPWNMWLREIEGD